VYVQLFSVRRNASFGGGPLPMMTWYMSVAGWNDEDRLVEWRAQVTAEIPAHALDLPKFEKRKTRHSKSSSACSEFLHHRKSRHGKGPVSEEAVLGDLPAEIR
jgi:hypothetical protein